MALSIKSIPVLGGQSAIDFVREAEANAKLPTPRLTPQEENELHKFMEKSRNFKLFS